MQTTAPTTASEARKLPRFRLPPGPSEAFAQRLGLAGLILFASIIAYSLTFVQVGIRLSSALEFAFINVAAACVPGALAWWLAHRMAGTVPTLQAALHVPLALAFSWAWYGISRLMGATLGGLQGRGWEIGWLPDAALAWQLTQGLSVYAAIVAAAYASLLATRARTALLQAAEPLTPEPQSPAAAPVRRFLARAGDGLAPLDVDDIVLVEGADDYSEVTTLTGERRLVRLSLKAFEAQLGDANFVRVHRSALIALDRLIAAEPAGGGRMLLQLVGGRTLHTSREGARKLRARMI